ncbi:MAG: hypothetical protein ACI840_002302 [Ulvibacter sp.]|jgi:hypothetical protein
MKKNNSDLKKFKKAKKFQKVIVYVIIFSAILSGISNIEIFTPANTSVSFAALMLAMAVTWVSILISGVLNLRKWVVWLYGIYLLGSISEVISLILDFEVTITRFISQPIYGLVKVLEVSVLVVGYYLILFKHREKFKTKSKTKGFFE